MSYGLYYAHNATTNTASSLLHRAYSEAYILSVSHDVHMEDDGSVSVSRLGLPLPTFEQSHAFFTLSWYPTYPEYFQS